MDCKIGFCLEKRLPLDQAIYLPEYLSGTVPRSFDDEELVKMSMGYLVKMERSLRGNLLMAKYDKVNEAGYFREERFIGV